jgi:hypothetical protein
MDQPGMRAAAERRQRQAAQAARLRAAEWPDWSLPSGENLPSHGEPSDDELLPASLAPTRRIAPAWDRRAMQIAEHHTAFDDDAWSEHISEAAYDDVWDASAPNARTIITDPRLTLQSATLPSMPVVAAHRAPTQRRLRRGVFAWLARHWRRGPMARAMILGGLTAMLFACCAPLAVIARAAYAATDGYHHLMQIDALVTQQGAAGLVNPANQTFLHDQLAAAHADFVVLGQMLALTGPLETAQSSLHNLARLTQLAVDLTGGGQALLDVASATLGPLLADPFAPRATAALSPAALLAAHGRLMEAQAQLDDAAALAPTITTDGLPGSFSANGKLSMILAKVGQAARLARYFGQMLGVAPQLLGVGKPATYLLLAMDHSELRTGGGFIGNYGLLSVTNAHLQSAALQDTYVLDAAYFARTGQQPPAMYPWWPYHNGSAIYGWGLRDSNLSPDFPTNARTALGIVHAVQDEPTLRAPTPPVGVLAITSAVLAQIITVGGGSLRLSEYPDHIITPQNLDDTIHCFQLGACRAEQPVVPPGTSLSADRKRFTAFLGQTLVDRVRHFSGSQLKAFMKDVFQDLATKDLQVYLTPTQAEGVLLDAGLGGGIVSPTADTWFVTDTNIGGNKANAFVTQTEDDIVTLLPGGAALHRLLIRTTYHRQGPLYEGSTGQTSYWDYRRIYFPAGARFLDDGGFAGGSGRHALHATTASDTRGYAMFGAALSISDGLDMGQCQPFPHGPTSQPWDCAPQVRDTYLAWIAPHAWQRVGNRISYSLTIQRQPGSNVSVSVHLDASHIADGLSATQLAAATRDPDLPSAASATGFAATTNAAWNVLLAHTPTLTNGALTQNLMLQWGG